ncbi:hypothetical protein LPB86_18480 [Pedobacter sp. MC2016-14]|uniref:lycopene cyclase family protein n=1 Tax=Pedobacter sp. MC2016-14 TaxID=2897327 RepID=UPI001E296565|nr:lycopene cyclase family protein [Pedobacter sp. MC2016-14]MCD0490234.1 hypothetical protein [Pedobacter sp. MC2016-14]
MENIKCDIIISGGGMAGLSLLYRALKEGLWHDKHIVVVDKHSKQNNDKTWSFWKKEQTDFDEIISHSWNDLLFYSNSGKQLHLDAAPYTYCTIRSLDFYNFVLAYLKTFPNVSFYLDEVRSWYHKDQQSFLHTARYQFAGEFLFNSIYQKPVLHSHSQYFLQHFKGVIIQLNEPTRLRAAHLMDFRTSQEHGTTFFYTLPLSESVIFVEYTIFSKSLLRPAEYDAKIETYINDELNITQYKVIEEEFGAIPMTDHMFNRFDGSIVNIGTAGGDTRASTGYTFINTQKTISKILHSLKQHGHASFGAETIALKQQLYDSTLLNVLDGNRYQGHQLFYDLFKGTPASTIFSFLDAETSIFEDLQIMKSLRVAPFLKSFLAAVYRKLRG